jgi:hypothetical protein
MSSKTEYAQNVTAKDRGILLENLTWQDAAKVPHLDTIVVIPIGGPSQASCED